MPNHEGNTAVLDAKVTPTVKEEKAKVKTGDKVPETAKTTVDGTATEKGPRAPRAPKNVTYRILDGVDAAKFSGQKGHVIRAMQKLSETHGADKHFTVEEIAKHADGLVSKTPIEASVNFHLKSLVKDGQVSVKSPEPPAKVEKIKEEKAA
jgi:hypothetical protein